MKENLEKRQSEVIAAMRFPLMVLLLFAHVLPMTSIPIEMNFSEMNVYHLFSEGISHNPTIYLNVPKVKQTDIVLSITR